MLVECLRAQELLAEQGVRAEVIDPITLSPLDHQTIADSAARTGNLLVVDNGWTTCGASAEIVARVVEQGGLAKEVNVARMGFAPTTCPPTPSLEWHFYPNPATIAAQAHAMVRPARADWAPDPERAKLAYQSQFRGPF
jgi:pyruvate dehydrogenase E1 component beta subunit